MVDVFTVSLWINLSMVYITVLCKTDITFCDVMLITLVLINKLKIQKVNYSSFVDLYDSLYLQIMSVNDE